MAWWLSVGASVGWRVVLAGLVLAGLVVGPGLLVLLSHHGRAASDDAPRSRLQVLGATGKTSGTGGVDHLVCRSYVCWWWGCFCCGCDRLWCRCVNGWAERVLVRFLSRPDDGLCVWVWCLLVLPLAVLLAEAAARWMTTATTTTPADAGQEAPHQQKQQQQRQTR